jgi:molecular chaperone Hsp33
MKDTLQKFMVDNAPVRGELVDLSATWQQVLARRDYPVAVQTLLGEMLSAAALLTANLKFNGTIVMQIHGDGPIKLLVVECDSHMQLRATAKITEGAVVEPDATLTQLVNANGEGRFAITLDPNDKMPGQQAYQGIVPLDGDNVASVIENYMLRSEQLDTKLWLAADGKISRGVLLQKLPTEGGKNAPQEELETWNRLSMLGNTLRAEEMLSTDIETLMHRLFWEEDLRVFEPEHPQFHCSCSRERVGNMLKMLGQGEIEEALASQEKLGINCDFCGQHYEFDAIDCAQLFVTESPTPTVSQGDTRH